MATNTNFSRLNPSGASFSAMIEHFGVVTVMNADVYELDNNFVTKTHTAEEFYAHYIGLTALAHLDTLKIANITVEGPSKTVTGGQYSNPLIKFGKTARIEMQDALGNAKAIEAFGGCVNEYGESNYSTVKMVHMTEDFAPSRVIIGDSFFIDQKTGSQVGVKVILYNVLPDSIFNFTQDAEGDATVFDLNGDLLTTVIKIPVDAGRSVEHGVFYSILDSQTTSSKRTYSGNGAPAVQALVNKDAEVLNVDEIISISIDEGVSFKDQKITAISFTAGNVATVKYSPVE